MIEKILSGKNIRNACKQVMSNQGSAGVDGMPVKALPLFLKEHLKDISTAIRNGGYLPQSILGVEIPKGKGKTRLLGIPTVADRLLQQAVSQVISPKFELEFKEYSYGFCPDRNAHQAVQQAQKNIHAGYDYIVDIDLKSFFDEVDHAILLQLLYSKVQCPATLRLIRKWLRAPIQINGKLVKRRKGVPQGSPITSRTHSQTLSFQGGFKLNEANLIYFIKSSIFMINATSTELRIGQTYQQCVYHASKRKIPAADCRAVGREVWCLSSTGLPLCATGQRDQREDNSTRKFRSLYCETTTHADQTCEEAVEIKKVIDQQSGPYSARRFFSQEGSCSKRRNKLGYHLPMTGYGSKSSRRFIIFLFRPMPFSLSNLQMN